MGKSYKKQILDHNVEKFSLMVRDDIDMFFSTETLTEADKNAALQFNSVSGAKSITEDLKWHVGKDERIRLRHSRLSSNYWHLAKTTANKAGIPGLIDALAVFIKQKRANIRGKESASNKRQKKDNSSWARKYLIQIHGFIITWRAKGDNERQVQYKRQAVHYTFNWHKSEDDWQRDHVWI